MRFQLCLASLSLIFTLAHAQTPPLSGALFIEPALSSAKCLTAASNADGAFVTIQACANSTAQQWTFTGGSVKLFGNTKCLDVTDGSTVNGNKLQIWTCSTNSNPNQQFFYTVDNHFSWTNMGKCIDLSGGSLADGNRPQIWDCEGSNPNQFWNAQQVNAPAGPKTVVLDGARLAAAKVSVTLGTDPAYAKALAALTAQADDWLDQGPWTVTSTKVLAPGSTTTKDYASQAPYFWPSDTPDGCPWVERDGVHNPAVDVYTDHNDRGSMFQASYILTLAWYYTGNAQYAQKAGQNLRTWFLTNATAMTPNLLHAQFVPCANTGRSIGIIDFSQQYTALLDAAAILATGAPGWTASDISGFKAWNVDFLNWLETSSFGVTETAATNNHGTFAIMQSAAIALFTGNTALATAKANLGKTRVAAGITANGSQPMELARTRSFHYSTFDLVAYTRLAAVGKKVGVDLWGYTGPQGQSINGAVDFVIPAATGAAAWAFPELNFTAFAASDIVHAAADAGNAQAIAAVGKVPTPPGGDLWLLRPAVEQLDPVTG